MEQFQSRTRREKTARAEPRQARKAGGSCVQIAGVPGLELRVAQRHVDQLKAVLERRKERIPFHRAEHHAEIQFPAVRRGVARRASQMSFCPPCKKANSDQYFNSCKRKTGALRQILSAGWSHLHHQEEDLGQVQKCITQDLGFSVESESVTKSSKKPQVVFFAANGWNRAIEVLESNISAQFFGDFCREGEIKVSHIIFEAAHSREVF